MGDLLCPWPKAVVTSHRFDLQLLLTSRIFLKLLTCPCSFSPSVYLLSLPKEPGFGFYSWRFCSFAFCMVDSRFNLCYFLVFLCGVFSIVHLLACRQVPSLAALSLPPWECLAGCLQSCSEILARLMGSRPWIVNLGSAWVRPGFSGLSSRAGLGTQI